MGSPLHTEERQVQPHQEFITLTEKILCQVHHTFHPVQGNLWRCTHTRESQVEIQKSLQGSYSERKRIFAEHREVRDLLEFRADYDAQAALSKCSEEEHHTILLLGEKKNHFLSEARSELNMQELRVESADRALRESSLQIHSQRIEHYQANQSHGHSRREKVWLHTELEDRERARQETHIRTLGELEELKKFSCTETG